MMNVETAKNVFEATGFVDNAGSIDKLMEAGLLERSSYNEAQETIKEARKLYNPLDEAQVGDGATIVMFSDRQAGTIIKRTPKSILIQLDKATLLNADELEFKVGGFAAHCANQEIQKYSYERDEQGKVIKATKRKDGSYRVSKGGTRVIAGRRQFYDYNF